MISSDDLKLTRSMIFDGIPDDVVETFCAQGQEIPYGVNDLLFQRGEDANELMILKEGVVELMIPVQIMGVTRELSMETKQPGDVVAWSALVDPYHFTLSARCTSDCILTRFNRNTLYTFFESDPRAGYLFMRNLAGVIGRRLQAMQTMWMHDLQANAAKKLE